MIANDRHSIDLEIAQRRIVQACSTLSGEKKALSSALGRVSAKGHPALEDLPGYDGSLRDGYAVGTAADNSNPACADYRIIDEVAAGDTRNLTVGTGEAVRIMTGGLIPTGCQAVIPQENCSVEGQNVRVVINPLQQPKTFIHKKGSEITKGAVILEKGVTISSEQQVLLAGTGYNSVEVVRRPRVRFFCTGSELLTDTSVNKQAGQRFSGNSHLLTGLINRYGGDLLEQETVVDDSKRVIALIKRMAQNDCDILISTGGMGPGKFDLIEDAFARCGGETVYGSLSMRPGKATLFGKLGNTLFFGLPGPPPAVQLLFHELLRPAFCALQGLKQCGPQKIKAILAEDLILAKHGLLRLKSGVFHLHEGSCLVRTAKRSELANCYIFCSPERQLIPKGDMVEIHLTVSCLDSVLSG